MIELNNLVIGYRGQSIGIPPINIKFTIGSMTAITGANGSGKSTFLKTLSGLIPPIKGKINFNLTKCPYISYLPQQAELDHQFPLTVFDVVAMGCWPRFNLLNKINCKHQALIWQALENVGLKNLSRKTISVLSGGQFQRMLFARLLVQNSSLILLDEPFNSIDKQSSCLLMTIIKQMNHQGCTIISVLHDYDLVIKYFPNTLILNSNYQIWGPSSKILK